MPRFSCEIIRFIILSENYKYVFIRIFTFEVEEGKYSFPTENHQPPRNRNLGVANYNWSHALFGVPNHHNILQTYIKIPKIIKIVHNN